MTVLSNSKTEMKQLTFKDKVIIITGSSKGIGKVTAQEFCKKGAIVVLNGRDPISLQKTVDELTSKGYKVIGISGDVTDVKDCENLIQTCINLYGKLDILINNASLTMNGRLIDMVPSIFSRIFLSNSLGTIIPTQLAIPHIQKTKGSIIFISSLAGMHGLPRSSAYSAGKIVLTSFWQSLKIELKDSGIHFGIIYLSFTKNDENKKMIASDGSLTKVPHRPAFLQQSQQSIAFSIIKMIKSRRSKKVLSPLGKLTAVIARHFPRTSLFLIANTSSNGLKTQ